MSSDDSDYYKISNFADKVINDNIKVSDNDDEIVISTYYEDPFERNRDRFDERILVIYYYLLTKTKKDEKTNENKIRNMIRSFVYKKINEDRDYSWHFGECINDTIKDIDNLLFYVKRTIDLNIIVPWNDDTICCMFGSVVFDKAKYRYDYEDGGDHGHDLYCNVRAEHEYFIDRYYEDAKRKLKDVEFDKLVEENKKLKADNIELINMLTDEMKVKDENKNKSSKDKDNSKDNKSNENDNMITIEKYNKLADKYNKLKNRNNTMKDRYNKLKDVNKELSDMCESLITKYNEIKATNPTN